MENTARHLGLYRVHKNNSEETSVCVLALLQCLQYEGDISMCQALTGDLPDPEDHSPDVP